ncbi:DUF6913 domain-containing protein [Polaribacter uvawellassae]|uniref:DUF6913 domain-containing protein n=1 Tax=Polaribacter uvawellassae TaxID=3133495 RepID=UPI003219661B
MAFGKFKQKSLLKKFKKELNLIPETRTPNSKEIHSVAILTNNKLYEEIDISEHVKSRIESVRNVHIYSYRAFKKSDPITYKHFTEKDIDWNGKIKDASLESFLDNPFDLLIGYFDTNNLYLEYCALKSKATFKIGFSKVNDKIFDLVVTEDPKNIDSFIDVIKKYLELLHKI